MSLINIPKGLFSLKKNNQNDKQEEIDSKINDRNHNALEDNFNIASNTISVDDKGFKNARELNGSAIGLRICLNREYQNYKDKIANDKQKQEELKKPFRLERKKLENENVGIVQRKDRIRAEDIPRLEAKTERIRKEIADIRQNPEKINGDKSGKASFYIGLIILSLLTVYLFIFYSSASYSSFFKEFTISEIGIANSIFDAQALSKAFKDGFTELLLIITIPAVFLGLGYLIHKGSEKKGLNKFMFIGSLILVTFIFDVIIAFEICEKIYNIKKNNSFQDIPDYTFGIAFQSINFWLIIFAGFVVYIIWGLVFDFTIEAHEKQDKVRIVIEQKELEIKNTDEEIEKLNAVLNQLEETKAKNTTEIKRLDQLIDHTTIIPKEFEIYLFHFMKGWIHWMEANQKMNERMIECNEICNQFISTTIKPVESINN
jgi:hypothetical protein